MKSMLLVLLIFVTACNSSEVPIQREEEYRGKDTPGRQKHEEEIPLKKGVFDESDEKNLNLDN